MRPQVAKKIEELKAEASSHERKARSLPVNDSLGRYSLNRSYAIGERINRLIEKEKQIENGLLEIQKALKASGVQASKWLASQRVRGWGQHSSGYRLEMDRGYITVEKLEKNSADAIATELQKIGFVVKVETVEPRFYRVHFSKTNN